MTTLRTITPSIIEVSKLVKQAFGRKVRCDVTGNSIDTDFHRVASPFLIVRSKMLGLAYDILGRFSEKHSDGSVLDVFPRNEKQAEKYADLYEAEFGVRPKIRIVDAMLPYSIGLKRLGPA